MNNEDLKALEARIYRTLAEAIRNGFVGGYHSRGGPQDGDSTPDYFDVKAVSRELHLAAEMLEGEI